jgi:hypothetical protein
VVSGPGGQYEGGLEVVRGLLQNATLRRLN